MQSRNTIPINLEKVSEEMGERQEEATQRDVGENIDDGAPSAEVILLCKKVTELRQ